ncbi:GOLPH3/VPS74 family protein [[Mycobacterium] wendilense]|uniref:GPP34 family phosphoprotein n=1 Tax=[Mycobacterium] wendilense TaxID=3064284 RepID=A0ABM9MAJ7_9MYCO|nr:GPP34 family phosphoprotein [Mycolicibacterium sp. MU0050]CAJ1580420.1 GPP34 family phosphoprotein [Mycolicibacterium sp. MU0050]
MPAIAEELLLLLLDNASAQPALDPSRRRRVLAGAVLLDLAYQWRLRPAAPGEPVPEGRLIALVGPDDGDPTSGWAWQRLARKPRTAKSAVAKLQRDVETRLLDQLEYAGLLRRTPLYTKRFRRDYAWLLTDRNRAARVRSQLLRVLITGTEPAPATAAVITLLHTVGGLDELLSFDDRARRWVWQRAAEIASGSWVAADSDLAEVNLAVVAATVRAALR